MTTAEEKAPKAHFSAERRINFIENVITGAALLYIAFQFLPIVQPFGDAAVFLNVLVILALFSYTQSILALVISQSVLRFVELIWGKMGPQVDRAQRFIPMLSPLVLILVFDVALWYTKVIGNEFAIGGFFLGIPTLYKDEIIKFAKTKFHGKTVAVLKPID